MFTFQVCTSSVQMLASLMNMLLISLDIPGDNSPEWKLHLQFCSRHMFRATLGSFMFYMGFLQEFAIGIDFSPWDVGSLFAETSWESWLGDIPSGNRQFHSGLTRHFVGSH